MVHINGVPHDILSIATTVPIVPVIQIFSPTSAVIVAPPAAAACYDTPNWTDAYGQNCAYYAYNGGYRCALWGSDSSSAGGDGAVAVDNCCACGGGSDDDSSSGGAGPSPSSGSATTLADTTTSTTTTTTEGGDNAVVVGTCGKGKGERGNGICANGKCCSKFGWCGSTPAHCNYTNRPTATASIPTLAPITLLPTTTSPTTILDVIANWESMTYSIDINWDKLTQGHSKFCGPVIVGGYEIALAMCSPYTECGKTIITDHYGTNGNDCPEGLMCFGDIECMPPPTTTGSQGIMPAITTLVPTIDTTTTTTVATSSSYCGSTYADAKQECTPSTMCDTDDDCIKFGTTDDDGDSWGGKSCFTNISCTIGWQNDEDAIIITTTTPTAAFSPSASNSSGGASLPTTTAGTESADILLEGTAATSLLEGINNNSASSTTTTAGTTEITNNMKKTNTIIETSTPSITVTTTSPTTTTTTTTDITTHSITTSSLVESTPVFEVDTDDDVAVIANFQENKIGLTLGIGGLGGSERNNDENIISGDSNSQEFVPIWPADYSGAADGLLILNRRQWSNVGIMLLAAVLCRW